MDKSLKMALLIFGLIVSFGLLASCTVETEAERDLRVTMKGATMTADVVQVTATAEELGVRRTGTAQAQRQAVVDGLVAQTEIAMEMEATKAAIASVEAARAAAATAAEDARIQATQAYQAAQTQQAQQQTAAVEARNATNTAVAEAATATQAAKDDVVKGTATASFLGVIQERDRATQTALAEAQKSEEARQENERRAEAATLWFRTWAPRIGWTAAGVVAAVLLVYLVIWSWPWIVSRLSVHRENGKLVFVFPQKDGWAALIPGLNGQPGATVPDQQGDGRQLTTNGGFDDQTLQNQVAARSQAADVVRALMQTGEGQAPAINRQAVVRKLMQQGSGPQQPVESNGFRILNGAGELPAHLRPDVDTLQALDAEWRDSEE